MPDRLGPRFALEAVFLVVLAVLAAVADLSWPMIVTVMAAGWVLAAIYEYARWRAGPKLPPRVARAGVRQSPPAPPVDGPTRVIGLDADTWPTAGGRELSGW